MVQAPVVCYRSTALILPSGGWAGKSSIIQGELEQQYAFLGGEVSEWVKYLHRADTQHLWSFLLAHQVRACAGVSAVPPKSGKLRKLLMARTAHDSQRASEALRRRDHVSVPTGFYHPILDPGCCEPYNDVQPHGASTPAATLREQGWL